MEHLELAIRLSPRDQDVWSVRLAVALCHFSAGAYRHALERATDAAHDREMPMVVATCAAAAAMTGDTVAARRAAAKLASIAPRASIAGFGPLIASVQPAVAKTFLDALMRAGFPTG